MQDRIKNLLEYIEKEISEMSEEERSFKNIINISGLDEAIHKLWLYAEANNIDNNEGK